jgi:hypothetical protein
MRWQTTACKVPASCRRTCSRSSALKKSSIRRAHGGRETDGIPHFADHDDVGILAENVFEAVFEGERVETHLPLLDDGQFVVEDEFDGILERDNVLLLGAINVGEHGGQGGRLAAAGRSRHQDDAPWRTGDILQDGQQPQLFEGWNYRFDVAHRQAPLAALLENVRAEAAHAGHVVGEIDLAVGFEPGNGVFGNDFLDDIVHPLLGGSGGFNRNELAVNAENDRRADLNVDVRSAALHGDAENTVKDFHVAPQL